MSKWWRLLVSIKKDKNWLQKSLLGKSTTPHVEDRSSLSLTYDCVSVATGCTIGYAFMYYSSVASNPYALAAALCGMTLIAGIWGFGKYKLAIFFGLLGYSTLILCQYTGCHECTGNLYNHFKTPSCTSSLHYVTSMPSCLSSLYHIALSERVASSTATEVVNFGWKWRTSFFVSVMVSSRVEIRHVLDVSLCWLAGLGCMGASIFICCTLVE